MKKRILKSVLAMACLLCSINASAYDFAVDGFYYNIVSPSDLTCEVTYGDEKYTGEVVIPDVVTYKGKTLSVTRIGWNAFGDCSALTSVTIPNSVTSIALYAFWNCI